jgi:protein ImuA
MPDSIRPLARLKRQLEKLERPRRAGAGYFALGHAALDARLGGGLARGALHEICEGHEGDHAAASGFALMLAARAASEGAATERPILWVREDKGERMNGGLYGPGMVELGINPERLILVSAPDTLSALRVAADIIGVMALGAVVIELWGAAKALDLTASRRLVLAAERSGVVAFVLRAAGGAMASAASTRWIVAAAPSVVLPGIAPGATMLSLSLTRHRGGVAPFEMTLEWNRDEQIFDEPAVLRTLPAPAERGQMAA